MTDTPDHPLTGDVIDAPDVTSVWLTPPAAALRLGISERTLWRHVTAGRYHKRVVSGRAEVLLPGSGETPDNPASGSEIALPDTPVTEIVARLQRQGLTVTRQAIQIARLSDRLKTAEALLAAAESRAAKAEERLEVERRRSWWQRLLGR